MTDTQKRAILACASVLHETVVHAGPQGAPAGPMYAAVMGVLSLGQFQAIMGALVAAGKLRHRGHVYFAADVG